MFAASARDAGRPLPGARRRRVHPRVGRSARRRPRLDGLGRSRPHDRHRLGRRVRRRRREHDEPGRPYARRPGHRRRLRPSPCPWVNHRSRRWEPEPLRWIGINAGLRAMTVADHEEQVTQAGSAIARAMAPLLGGPWDWPASAGSDERPPVVERASFGVELRPQAVERRLRVLSARFGVESAFRWLSLSNPCPTSSGRCSDLSHKGSRAPEPVGRSPHGRRYPGRPHRLIKAQPWPTAA